MTNTREKLIELVVDRDMECNYMDCKKCDYFKVKHCKASMIADHLVANGIIVPPLKVGQKVYTIPRSAIREWTVCGVWISADPKCSYAHIYWEKNGHHMGSCAVNFSDIDRVLFLSREEAEAALDKWREEDYQ